MRYQLPYFDEFLQSLKVNNYSEETYYNYERDLKVFENFLNIAKIPFSKCDKLTINDYKAYLNSIDRETAINKKAEKKLSSRSINRMLSALKTYLKYLIEIDYQSPLLPEYIKPIKTEKKHPQVAELADLIKLIEAPMTIEKNKFVALRNRTALEVLFSTGMRISELIKLKLDQIDESGRIFIMGKGRKERFVYLTPRAKSFVDEYLKIRGSCPSEYLFIAKRGRNAHIKNQHLSANYLQAKIKFYRQILRINVPTSAHSLRHGFATYLAEKGANPAAIQILLGHESLDTTTRYVHASDKYAEETLRKYHPLKNRD
ncbi:MAG: tyrosine-type recombinase/integrase [Patescibacteria group bacterium]